MTETPSSRLKESISALVDGEHNDLDLQRVLTSMDDNDEAREIWSRYHVVSAVMKNDLQANRAIDLSAAVREALADEPAVKDFSKNLHGWWLGLGKTAVAATVTFGVVFAAQKFTSGPVDGAPTVAVGQDSTAESPGSVVPYGFELPPLSARAVSANTLSPTKEIPRTPINGARSQSTVVIPSDEFEKQINRLMFRHAEQASSSGGMGLIPFARVSELSETDRE